MDILQGKNSLGTFQMCLSVIFHDYKTVFKVRISSPLQNVPYKNIEERIIIQFVNNL